MARAARSDNSPPLVWRQKGIAALSTTEINNMEHQEQTPSSSFVSKISYTESSDEEGWSKPLPSKKVKSHEDDDDSPSTDKETATTTTTKKRNCDLSPEELAEKKRLKKQRRDIQRAVKAQEKIAEKQAKIAEERSKWKNGRWYSMSIAIPGSIIDNAQSPELRTYLAGQVARAAAIFKIDEIIIYDDNLGSNTTTEDTTRANKNADAHVFLSRVLQYVETPQYLRKALFPMHRDLKYAGLLNPLDCPHHMRADEWSIYREGVTVNRPTKKGSYVNIGLPADVHVYQTLASGVRVTVKLEEDSRTAKKLRGTVVPVAEPRMATGKYWGYTTRIASSLSKVWTECPYKQGYDLKIGTSERGHVSVDDPEFTLPSKFRHGLIVFGGVAGIEECVNNHHDDDDLGGVENGEDSHKLFDMWVNTCPNQGSRTIRSEEAMLISLSALRKHVARNDIGPPEEDSS